MYSQIFNEMAAKFTDSIEGSFVPLNKNYTTEREIKDHKKIPFLCGSMEIECL